MPAILLSGGSSFVWLSVTFLGIGVICSVLSACLSDEFVDTRRLALATATLLACCVAFSQDVTCLWMASLAYGIFATCTLLVVVLRRFGGASDVAMVATAVFNVVRVVAFADLLILVGLSLVERVIPHYAAVVA